MSKLRIRREMLVMYLFAGLITKTNVDVAALIENDEYRLALRRSVETYKFGPEVKAEIDRIINGTVVGGERMPDGLWDDASRRFAENVAGDVRVLAPLGKSDSVFAKTELPALLDNPKVTQVVTVNTQ